MRARMLRYVTDIGAILGAVRGKCLYGVWYNRGVLEFLKQQIENAVLIVGDVEEPPPSDELFDSWKALEVVMERAKMLIEEHAQPFEVDSFYRVSHVVEIVESICLDLRECLQGLGLAWKASISVKVDSDLIARDKLHMEWYLTCILDSNDGASDINESVRSELEALRSENSAFGERMQLIGESAFLWGPSIGQGDCSVVFHARWGRGFSVAVKKFKLTADGMSVEELAEFLTEAEIFSTWMRHPRIVDCLAATISGCLVLELAKMNLQQLYLEVREISWFLKIRLLTDAAEGLRHLHDCGIVHKAVRSPNFLVFGNTLEESMVKVADFGFPGMQRCCMHSSGSQGRKASDPWIAPENIDGKPFTTESDVFSFGIVMYEVASQSLPYEKFTSDQVPQRKEKWGEPCFGLMKCPEELKELMKQCINPNSAERPSMPTVCATLEGLLSKALAGANVVARSPLSIEHGKAMEDGNLSSKFSSKYDIPSGVDPEKMAAELEIFEADLALEKTVRGVPSYVPGTKGFNPRQAWRAMNPASESLLVQSDESDEVSSASPLSAHNGSADCSLNCRLSSRCSSSRSLGSACATIGSSEEWRMLHSTTFEGIEEESEQCARSPAMAPGPDGTWTESTLFSVLAEKPQSKFTTQWILSKEEILKRHSYSYDRTLLHAAAQAGNLELAAELVRQYIDIDKIDKYGRTALHDAARWGEIEVAQLLLENHADPSFQDIGGETPLHLAACHNHVKLVHLLVTELSEKKDLPNKLGNTPLHIAAMAGHLDVVRLLLEEGLDPTIKNKNRKRPQDLGDASVQEIFRAFKSERSSTKEQDSRVLKIFGKRTSKKAIAIHDDLKCLQSKVSECRMHFGDVIYNRHTIKFLLEQMKQLAGATLQKRPALQEWKKSYNSLMAFAIGPAKKMICRHENFDLERYYKVDAAKECTEKCCHQMKTFAAQWKLNVEISCTVPEECLKEDKKIWSACLAFVLEDRHMRVVGGALQKVETLLRKWDHAKLEYDRRRSKLRVVSIQEVKIGKVIGGNRFPVYVGELSGCRVAIKKCSTGERDLNHEDLLKFMNEAYIQAVLDHDHAVNLIAVTKSGWMIMELARCNLKQWYQQMTLDWRAKIRILVQSATGLAHMHGRNPPVTHCDIKTTNILMFECQEDPSVCIAKIADFGLSKVFGGTATTTERRHGGTLVYMAPELQDGKRPSTEADVFSFGVVMYELISQDQPYGQVWTDMGLIGKKMNGEAPCRIPSTCPAALSQLMKKCCAFRPSDRPSMQDVRAALLRINAS